MPRAPDPSPAFSSAFSLIQVPICAWKTEGTPNWSLHLYLTLLPPALISNKHNLSAERSRDCPHANPPKASQWLQNEIPILPMALWPLGPAAPTSALPASSSPTTQALTLTLTLTLTGHLPFPASLHLTALSPVSLGPLCLGIPACVSGTPDNTAVSCQAPARELARLGACAGL